MQIIRMRARGAPNFQGADSLREVHGGRLIQTGQRTLIAKFAISYCSFNGLFQDLKFFLPPPQLRFEDVCVKGGQASMLISCLRNQFLSQKNKCAIAPAMLEDGSIFILPAFH